MGPVGEERSAGVVVLLWIITLGIYGIWWQYRQFTDLKARSGNGIGGGLGLVLAIFFAIANVFILPGEVADLARARGAEPPVSVKTGFWVLLPLVGFIVWVVKVQGAINAEWEQAAS